MTLPKAVVVLALLQTTSAAVPDVDGAYRALIEEFATTPVAAVERMLRMPQDEVAYAVHEAAREDSGWTAEALDRALLLHADAALALARDRSADARRQIDLAGDLAVAAARLPGNQWFVHRWFRVFTAQVDARDMETVWHRQPWYSAAAAVDRARELETQGGRAEIPAGVKVCDLPVFRKAIPLLEQGVAAHLAVAALHLGRIQMLRGDDSAARRLFDIATNDQSSRVTRYLANLFLGAMDERQYNRQGADAHYREAVATLPHARSGRLALASLLGRAGQADEARRVLADAGSPTTHDPWRTYFLEFHEEMAVLAELHAEVCR